LATYRLVGYSQTRDLGRVRVYVSADDATTEHSPVFIAPNTAPFDYSGQPLQLRRASTGMTERVRADLLNRPVPRHCAEVPFLRVAAATA
jgi:hypothetical protein